MKHRTLSYRSTPGFTLVEMIIIAPIVILAIGAFIAVIVNLTGEVMSSRGSNTLAYSVQDALNSIEADVKLSTTFLATNSISVVSTKQGYTVSGTTGSTQSFANYDTAYSPPALILNSLVTDGNPLSLTTSTIYLANKPNSCSDVRLYSKNTPMTMNIVYYVANNTLWRRVIMPADYATTSIRCGSKAPWQKPSCLPGSTVTFCKASDQKLIEGISPDDFQFDYYNSMSASTSDPVAKSTSYSHSARNAALQSDPVIKVTLTAKKTIAGRAISSTGSIRVSRLDTNATSIAQEVVPTSAPAAPSVSSSIKEGHEVTFTWPSVPTATSYTLQYRINSGSWVTGSSNISNSVRSYTVTSGSHTDSVEARVTATNAKGTSGYGNNSVTIPLWAPLNLQNDWMDYSNTYGSAAYTKTKSGLVLLRGLIKSTGSPSVGSVIAQLPDDYKPTGTLIFETSTNPNAPARVDVTSAGNVLFSTGGSPTWFSLESVRFMSSSASRTALSLSGSATNFGSGYAPASYILDSVGRVTIEGLIKGQATSSETLIAPLTASLMPPSSDIMPTWSADTAAAFAVHPNYGGITARGIGGSSYISLNTSYIPSSTSTTWSNLSFSNSWSNYGSIYNTAQYTKMSDKVVHLRGLIKGGSTTYDTVIGTLPVGFRPKHRVLYTTVQNQNAYSRLDILPDGQVRFMGSNNGWYSLSNVLFVAEQ